MDFKLFDLTGKVAVVTGGNGGIGLAMARGLQADLRVVSDAEYPFALAYFTGSKEHNIVMRQRAIARGLRLNEYGLFRSEEETRDPKLRVIMDCGHTRHYPQYVTNTPGTLRFAENVAAFLLGNNSR